MNDENELLEPLATEAGQQAIVRAIRDISSLEYAVRAEQAASQASAKAGEASQSAIEASEAEDKAKDWATKTDTYVEQQIITIPPAQEGEEPTTETINLYSAKYYAALAQDIYNNMSFDSVPTENSTNMVNSGTVYSALDLKADKSTTYTKTETDNLINTRLAELVASAPAALDTLQELATALGNDPNFATTIATQLGNKADKSTTYTKTEVDTALSNVQSTLTFDNVPTANSDNPVKSSGIKTALDAKQDTLTFDSTPTQNSTNPVTSGGVYTALQNVDIDVDTSITQNSTNPVTSAAIYAALQNVSPAITIDSAVTESSTNPVTSAGIYDAIENAVGAGSLASGVVRELLFSSTSGVNSGTMTLSKSWKEFDALLFGVSYPTDMSNKKSIMYKLDIPKAVGDVGDTGRIITTDADRWRFIEYTNDTTISFVYSGMNLNIYSIYGIKFSKNLSEQMYSNVLYFNNSGVQSGTLSLEDNWDNYDIISFIVGYSGINYNDSSNNRSSISQFQFFVEEIKNRNSFFISDYDTRVLSFEVNENNTKSISILSRDGNIKLFKIVGYKLAKGGYSGIVSDARMTVKSGVYEYTEATGTGLKQIPITFDSPMPDTNYIVLTSPATTCNNYTRVFPHIRQEEKTASGFTLGLYCDSSAGSSNNPYKINWIAIRPNSYTREGMVEDVLFSNTNGVNSGTINLSGNISDYDLIQIYTNRGGANNQLTETPQTFSSSHLITLTGTTGMLNSASIFGYSNDYIHFYYASDTTLNIIQSYNLKILKVVGVKFGRYISGVAVDTTVTSGSNNVVTSGAVYTALQNAGGGSSVTVDSSITQNSTNPVESAAIYAALAEKQDSLTFDSSPTQNSDNPVKSGGVYTALAAKGDVTTNTDQNITGTKTFVGSKKVGFKQSTANDKLGFTLYGNTGTERGYLEFNPTNTVDGVTGLMTLGNYATSAAALTQVGFRRYSNISGASGAYNLLIPMVADARTPFSLTTTYQNFYLPLGFTDGTTTVKTAKSGVVDLSPLLASLEARISALEGN